MNIVIIIAAATLLAMLAAVAATRIGLREAADPKQSRWRHLTVWEKQLVAEERGRDPVGER